MHINITKLLTKLFFYEKITTIFANADGIADRDACSGNIVANGYVD